MAGYPIRSGKYPVLFRRRARPQARNGRDLPPEKLCDFGFARRDFMTVRDVFARDAMGYFISMDADPAEVARECYRIADEMMHCRSVWKRYR